MFGRITPESIGISSSELLRFASSLHSYTLSPHGIILAKGTDIFFECYYAPYKVDTLHRMYSVSKSFIALAAGIASEEGLISLDDKLVKYFPEYAGADKLLEQTTIRNCLTMRSSMACCAAWYGKPDRAASYFTVSSNQLPETSFCYDSAGSFMVGCAIERACGKPFLDYLKEKVFDELGFSKNAYSLLAPGGHSHGDSGVMCTPRDILIFANLLLGGGVYNGKRYVSEEFVRLMTSRQTDNFNGSTADPLEVHGYGYLVWKLPRDGFAFVGMANQLMLCDPATELIMIITSEDMGKEIVGRTLYFDQLYGRLVPAVEKRAPLAEDKEALSALSAFAENASLLSLSGSLSENDSALISGVTYYAEENKCGISSLTLYTDNEGGRLEYMRYGKLHRLDFLYNRNYFGRFPTEQRMSAVASQYQQGDYACATSAVWCEPRKIHIMSQVIDDYEGTLHIELAFDKAQGVPERVNAVLNRRAQRILDDYSGRFIARRG